MRHTGVLSILVFAAVLAGCGGSTEPDPVILEVDGVWSGTTIQGHALTFVVSNGIVTGMTSLVEFPCSWVTARATLAATISDSAFAGGDAGEAGLLTGAFTSATRAAGTLRRAEAASAPLAACSGGTLELGWQAVKGQVPLATPPRGPTPFTMAQFDPTASTSPTASMSSSSLQPIPEEFSWVERGIMTSVKDQRIAECGSCGMHSAVGVLEALVRQRDGVEVDLSEQQLVNCVREMSGCGGGWSYWAHAYMVRNGIVRESVYPYLASEWECDLTAPSEFYLTKAWSYRPFGAQPKSERREAIKHIIMTYGPVDAVMAVYEDFYNDYISGVYVYDGVSPFRTYHGIVIAGWVDDASVPTGGYWIVKNEWGEAWGENGYGRVMYDPEDLNLIEFDIQYALYDGNGN